MRTVQTALGGLMDIHIYYPGLQTGNVMQFLLKYVSLTDPHFNFFVHFSRCWEWVTRTQHEDFVQFNNFETVPGLCASFPFLLALARLSSVLLLLLLHLCVLDCVWNSSQEPMHALRTMVDALICAYLFHLHPPVWHRKSASVRMAWFQTRRILTPAPVSSVNVSYGTVLNSLASFISSSTHGGAFIMHSFTYEVYSHHVLATISLVLSLPGYLCSELYGRWDVICSAVFLCACDFMLSMPYSVYAPCLWCLLVNKVVLLRVCVFFFSSWCELWLKAWLFHLQKPTLYWVWRSLWSWGRLSW